MLRMRFISDNDDDIYHLQPNKGRGEMKELRMLCAEDEQSRSCWMTAFRIFKVIRRLKKIFNIVFQLRHTSAYTA